LSFQLKNHSVISLSFPLLHDPKIAKLLMILKYLKHIILLSKSAL